MPKLQRFSFNNFLSTFLSKTLALSILPWNGSYLRHQLSFLSQHKYIVDLLYKTHMIEAKLAPTPLATSPILTLQLGTPLLDSIKYCIVVDRLQYLYLIRLNVAYAMNKLS
mgnify:FL=1